MARQKARSTHTKPAKATAKTKTTARGGSASSPGDELRGELRQLGEIRKGFPALSPQLSSQLLAQHDEAMCRERGGTTRAGDTFRGAMLWARTLGEHPADAAVEPSQARWFLDCLTALGGLLSGGAQTADPSRAAAFADAQHQADEALGEAKSRARRACGKNDAWLSALDAALEPDPSLDARVSTLRKLASLLESWFAAPGDSPPLAAYRLSSATVEALRAAATKLDQALATRPAPQQFDRDSPAINVAEGRLYFAMRTLWDEFSEARSAGKSALQLPVTNTLSRGLDLHVRRPKGPGAPDPTK
jgi:hypothetical protein